MLLKLFLRQMSVGSPASHTWSRRAIRTVATLLVPLVAIRSRLVDTGEQGHQLVHADEYVAMGSRCGSRRISARVAVVVVRINRIQFHRIRSSAGRRSGRGNSAAIADSTLDSAL